MLEPGAATLQQRSEPSLPGEPNDHQPSTRSLERASTASAASLSTVESPPTADLDLPTAVDVVKRHLEKNPSRNTRPTEEYLRSFSHRSRTASMAPNPSPQSAASHVHPKPRNQRRKSASGRSVSQAVDIPDDDNEDHDSELESDAEDRKQKNRKNKAKVQLGEFTSAQQRFIKIAQEYRTAKLLTHSPWPTVAESDRFSSEGFAYAQVKTDQSIEQLELDVDRALLWVS